MERDWTKKRIVQLAQADPQVIEQWLDEYTGILYTWLYFQIGADADIAADLTGRTFAQAVQNLDQFNPDRDTMLAWLRQQAVQARDEGLLRWQMKPQRPWAWSQLPKPVLAGLSRLRSEPLSEDITNNPFVQEMVQAALAEMEPANRDLMMHRYNHLDAPENIAAEMEISIKDVGDRLYRCRHFFRRMFVQLIQSENPGFAETAAAGGLELLDVNLEKLLSSTDMVLPISDKHRTKIHETLLEAARSAALTIDIPAEKKTYPAALLAGVAAIVLIGIAAGIILFSSKSTTESQPPTVPAPPKQQTPSPTVQKPRTDADEPIDQEELKRVFLLGQAGDLRGLLEILKTGQSTSQFVAANFIGKIADESAIGLLEESEAKWYPNGPEDNPFALAIAEIENRLSAQSGTIIEEPNEAKPAPDRTAEKPVPPAPQPAIAGTVTDASGNPVPNARIALRRNPLYGNDTDTEILNQTTTDEQGKYQFARGYEGPAFIECQAMPDDSMTITQAVWCAKDTLCRAEFGGKPAVSGVLNPAAESAWGQMLYLSDTLDPSNASFLAQTIAGADGQFTFAGIPAGLYFLLNKTADNRFVRIDTLQAIGQDVRDWQVNVAQANLGVQFEQSPESLAIANVNLTYGPDASMTLQRFPLQPQEDETWLAENVPTGGYTLIVRFENGMRLQQEVELAADQTLTIPAPEGTAALSGQFTASSESLKFFLHSAAQQVRFDLLPDTDGFYSIKAIPPDAYSLATVVHDLQLDLMVMGLQSNSEQALDIDPRQWIQNYSPLYVAVTNTKGALVNAAQVWVTGAGEVVTAQSSGRGAFLAVPPGEYTIHAALPGLTPVEKQIQVQAAPLTSQPGTENTILLQLNTGQARQP